MTANELHGVLVSAGAGDLEDRLQEQLALYAYGFTPRPVLGAPGVEVWQDEGGALYTRDGALRAIKFEVSCGGGEEYPEAWAGPVEGVGPMLASPKPQV